MKFLSPRMHGVMDYLTASAFLVVPRAMNWGDRSSKVMTASGLGIITMSLLTRYDLGLIRILPMKGHLAIDGVLDAALVGAQFVLKDERPDVRRTILAFAGLGTLVMLMTRTR